AAVAANASRDTLSIGRLLKPGGGRAPPGRSPRRALRGVYPPKWQSVPARTGAVYREGASVPAHIPYSLRQVSPENTMQGMGTARHPAGGVSADVESRWIAVPGRHGLAQSSELPGSDRSVAGGQDR